MAIVTYPLNNITYNAADAETYFSTRTSGVFANSDNLDLTITAARKVSIGTGLAWIKNTAFAGKSVAVKEAEELEFDAPDNTLNRIDRVVLGFDASANKTTLYVKKGSPASSPVAPTLSKTASLYELGLYDVSIPAGLTALSTANITDQRANAAVCGIMNDGVTPGGTGGTSIDITLTTAGWSNKQQTVSSAAFQASGYKYIVGPAYASADAYNKAKIKAKDVTTDGQMTFVCETTPTAALSVQILKVRVQ